MDEGEKQEERREREKKRSIGEFYTEKLHKC